MKKLLLAFVAVAVLAAGAGAQSVPTVVIIVRHAEKGTVPANDPPLTEAGMARAQALAAVLADAKVDAVISTPTARTLQTARPAADSRGLTIETVATGPLAEHAKAVAEAALKHAGKTVLIVGHSNTVAAIIGALGGPKMADLCDSQYSMLFVLVIDGRNVRFIKSSYGAATPDTPEKCAGMGR